MPAVAFSILSGNLFYAWQAHRLAERTGRTDVTAIPFGVNTPTIFAYVFLIMLPVYQRTHDTQLAWHLGVFACFLSGIVQTAGAFCTDWLRRHTPRAALLCPLAGIAIAFLCLGFVLRIFQTPELALLPTVIISRLRITDTIAFPDAGRSALHTRRRNSCCASEGAPRLSFAAPPPWWL